MEISKFNDYSGKPQRSITVYCWSRTEKGSALWEQAERVGTLAANHGFTVVTGGYCGSMEAVSKGASEESKRRCESKQNATLPKEDPATTSEYNGSGGVDVVGMLVPGQFPDRVLVGNKYLTSSIDANNMAHRLDLLTSQSRYYIILPGTLGTLTELTLIWSLSLLHHSDLPKPIIICFRDPWEKTIKDISNNLKLPGSDMSLLVFVDTPEEAMTIIVEDDKKLHQA